jgi:hypothetical protein
MLRLFISQPMNGKTNEEIERVRKNAIERVKKGFPDEEVEVIDSFFKDVPDVKERGLYYLGKSLELLATADVAYFAGGWEGYRGCRIEYRCATEYGIAVMGEIKVRG